MPSALHRGARIVVVCASAAAAMGVARPRPAFALDKQGSAHAGEVAGAEEDTSFNVSGSILMGVAIINPTYAARPDNTGLALMRYAGHADVDLYGRRLSVPIDINLFSNREKNGVAKLSPTELDVIGGLTTTHTLVRGVDAELGARVEHDMPVDRGGFTQTYADVRGRMLYSLAAIVPGLKRDLVDGDVSGAFTLGWFAVNPTYAARPDNTGIALFRYAARTELSVWKDRVSLGFDATFFSDRRRSAFAPSELDATYEIIGHEGPFELHLAYERDMPIDRGGLVQSFVYALFVYNFDLRREPVAPLHNRGTVVSP